MTADSSPAKKAVTAQMAHADVMSLPGVHLHFSHCHAIERVRERREPRVKDWRRDSALRITMGELEQRPGALNRMD